MMGARNAAELVARLRARGLALALRRAARRVVPAQRFGGRDRLPEARLLWPGDEK